jgi:hypothetical protein
MLCRHATGIWAAKYVRPIDCIHLSSPQPTLSVPRRVVDDCDVHQHGYCRVHVHPKRFPLAYDAKWQVCVKSDRMAVQMFLYLGT